MIVKNYDIGWGQRWPMKQLEQEILEHTLVKFRNDNSRTVVINSVWYTNEYHQQVMQELKELQPTDRKSTRLNSSHIPLSRMPSSA